VRIFIGNLSYKATEEDLQLLFAEYGSVTDSHVVIDRETQKPKGIAFVEMADGGQSAIEKLDQSTFMGRRVNVSEAKPRASDGRKMESRDDSQDRSQGSRYRDNRRARA
jgi:RNA recognition motif-containing protein